MIHHCACCNRRDGPPSLLKSKIAVCAATPRGSTASTIANANPCDAIGHPRRARNLPHRPSRRVSTLRDATLNTGMGSGAGNNPAPLLE